MAIKMKNEFKIGLLVAIAITFLILGFNFLRGRGLFSNEDEYYVYYNDVTGLQKSAPVVYQGVQVGKVLDIQLQPDRRVKVTLGMNNKQFAVPVGSHAQLVSDNLLAGTKNITFLLSENSNKIKPGDTIASMEATGMFDNISSEAGPLIASAHHTITTIDTLVSSVNTIINTQARTHLESSFQSLDQMLKELAILSTTLNQQTSNLNAVMTNLKSVTDNLSANNSQVTAILNNAEKATGQIANAKIEESFEHIEAATQSIQHTLKQIESSDGSLGMLIRDRRLYDNLNTTLSSLDTVLQDVKKRPSRYINVSVFGRKVKDN